MDTISCTNLVAPTKPNVNIVNWKGPFTSRRKEATHSTRQYDCVVSVSAKVFRVCTLTDSYKQSRLNHVCSCSSVASNFLYLAFTLGCALSATTSMPLVFLFIVGCVGSAQMTIAGGTVAGSIRTRATRHDDRHGRARAYRGAYCWLLHRARDWMEMDFLDYPHLRTCSPSVFMEDLFSLAL